MTDELIKSVILGLPNFGAVILMLFWQQRRIDKVLADERQLVERCLALLEECQRSLTNDRAKN